MLQIVEARYNGDGESTHKADVVYGDTDSVMVKFGPSDLKTVMELGAVPIVIIWCLRMWSHLLFQHIYQEGKQRST